MSQQQFLEQQSTTTGISKAAGSGAQGDLGEEFVNSRTTPREVVIHPEPREKQQQQQQQLTPMQQKRSQSQAQLVQQLQQQLQPLQSTVKPPSPVQGLQPESNGNLITSGPAVSAGSCSSVGVNVSAVAGGSPGASRRGLGGVGLAVSVPDAILDMEASTLARHLGVGSDGEGEVQEAEPSGSDETGSDEDGDRFFPDGIVPKFSRPAAAAVGLSMRAFGALGPTLHSSEEASVPREVKEGARSRTAAGLAAVASGAAAKAAAAAPMEAPAVAMAATGTVAGGPTRRPPPGTPRQPRSDEVGRTEYFSACPTQGLEYQSILRVHRRAILCGAVRKCSRGGGGGSSRGPSWLLLSGGEDGYVLWDLSRCRPLLLSLEDEADSVQTGSWPATTAVSTSMTSTASGGEGDMEQQNTSRTVAPRPPGVTNWNAIKQIMSVRMRVGVAESVANPNPGGDTAAGVEGGPGGGGGGGGGGGTAFPGDSCGSDSDERSVAPWQGASYRNMITAAAFVSDHKWATCHPGGTIRVWAADSSYSSATLEHTLHGHVGYINNIASYNGGRYAITTGLDTTARNWDLVEGCQLSVFKDHENEVTAVAVMESGKMALTTAEVVPEVASAMLWDPATGHLLHTLSGHHGWLFGVALSERRKIAVAIGEHATLFIWNTDTGDLLLSKVVASDGMQRWASINSDGNFLCFGSAEGVVRVVETYYGCEVARFDSTWVDPDFHSISACFFCDDELHDDPEHWANKFLSLHGDSDVSCLFRPLTTSPSLGRSLSQRQLQQQQPLPGTLSSLGTSGMGITSGLPPGLASSAGSGNKSTVRARVLHSVRAAAALAAIGRAAAAGKARNDLEYDDDQEEDLDGGDGGCGSGRGGDGGGNASKVYAALKAFSVSGAGGGGGVAGIGRRAVGTRRVAPLPARLDRITTDPRALTGSSWKEAPESTDPVAVNTTTAHASTNATALANTATGHSTVIKTARFSVPCKSVDDGDDEDEGDAIKRPSKELTKLMVGTSRRDGGNGEVSSDGEGSLAPPAALPSIASGGINSPTLSMRPIKKMKSAALNTVGGSGWPTGRNVLESPVTSIRRRRTSAQSFAASGGGGGGGGAPSRPASAVGGLSGWGGGGGGGGARPGSVLGVVPAVAGSTAAAAVAASVSGNSMGSGLQSVSRSGPSGNLQVMLGNRDATELEISPFGRRIVSLSGDGTVRVWSLLGVSVRRELPRHPEMVNEICISQDRTLVATVTENEGCLRLFSMSTGHLVATVAAHVGFDCDGVALSDDASLISHNLHKGQTVLAGTAVTCSDDTTVKIWNLSAHGGPALVRTLYGHAGGVTGVCWVPRTSRVLSVGEDRSVLEWETGPKGGRTPVARMDHVHEDAIAAVVVSPDARRALTCSMDRTARLWELTPPALPSSASAVATRGSTAAATGSRGGSKPALAHAAAAAAAAMHASQAASGGPHVPPRPELHRFVHENSVTHGTFSPDGRHVVTCGADCAVRLWDTDNGKQLVCFEGHTRTVTRCVYLNNYVVATTSRDGTIRCWDMQRKRRLPTLAPPFALENDSFEAMVLLPSQRCSYGFPEVLASLTSGRVVVYDPTYRQPLPEQLLLQLNPELELLNSTDVEDLVIDFPGLLVMPIRDGNTMLHMVSMSGDSVLLRALLSGTSGALGAGSSADYAGGGGGGSIGPLSGGLYGNAPPLPLNFMGQTPLDLAVAAGHRRCAELLLTTELARPPEQRLAVLRAWHSLAVEMPSLLVSFLKALSLDPAGGLEEDVLFAPLRARDEVMTLGSEDLAAEDLWLDHVNQLREDLMHLPWYSKVWPLKQLWDYREKPTSPSVAGLPYVAMAARNMEHSPLGVLVQYGLSQALASDVMYAVLFYKWDSFARAIFVRESLVFVAFLALYLVASTMSVRKSPHVEFHELYNLSKPSNVIRTVLEVVIAVMALHDIYGEINEIINAGWYMYLAGSQGSWNGLEITSCIGLLLTFGLQLGGFEGGSRFAMSLTTILLGLRLLKVASGPEHTGVFVQALLRIVSNLRFFMLILVVLVLTFSVAFWQIMSFDLPPGEKSRRGKEFDTLGNSIVTAYAFGVIGQMDYKVATDFSWRPWMQVLMLTYTFLITVILLNLLVAVMSDTYSVVKEHARSEWLLLRAKLILEIESSLPDGFFKDSQRSCPRWLHCLKVDTSGGRRGDDTLIESLRGPLARHVLNTDLNKTEARLVEELHDVRDTLKLLHADVGNMRTAVAAVTAVASTAMGNDAAGTAMAATGITSPHVAMVAASAAAATPSGGGNGGRYYNRNLSSSHNSYKYASQGNSVRLPPQQGVWGTMGALSPVMGGGGASPHLQRVLSAGSRRREG